MLRAESTPARKQLAARPQFRHGEASAAATSVHLHLIVLDVMLPDLDGFEVQRRLVVGRVDPVAGAFSPLISAATRSEQREAR
jgi:CheY-like chemotaxis protein